MQTELLYRVINKIVIIKVEGEINSINRDDLNKMIVNKFLDFDTLIFDFGTVTYITSTTIGFLIGLVKDKKNIIAVAPVKSFARATLNMLRIDRFFHIFNSIKEAMEHLGVEYENDQNS